MIRQTATAISMTLLAAACSQGGGKQATTMSFPDSCEPVRYQRCTGDPNVPHLNMNTQGNIRVNPSNVCANKGETLKFNITPNNPDRGFVFILPKNPDNTWLFGSNNLNRGEIEIDIPDGIPDGEYEYYVLLDDGRCLDPRVHVR